MKYDIELRIFSKEDRRTIAAILSDNGYDVGQHTKKAGKLAVRPSIASTQRTRKRRTPPMKYKPLTATVDAYQLTKDYATDSPKWVRDRIGTRLFENTTIRDGAVRFDGLTSIIQNRKLRERMTARPGDYLVRMQDGNVAVYTKRNFEALYAPAEGQQA